MSIYLILLIYFSIGTVAGLLSGLLGIGGGLFVVPALSYTFQQLGFPEDVTMHLAIGTSFAIMIITTARSMLAHMSRQIEFWSIYKRFMVGVIAGTVLGAFIGHALDTKTLKIIFAVFVFLMAIETFFSHSLRETRQLPGWRGTTLMGSVIGLKSGLLGVGGGALSIPLLTFFSVSMRRAVVTSVAMGLTIAITGSLMFALRMARFHEVLPPWTLGYIYLPAWMAVSIGVLIFAPLGAKISYKLPVTVLRKVFAVFLILVGLHLVLQS